MGQEDKSEACGQFCVDTAVDVAQVLNTCTERNQCIVYIDLSLNVKRAYYGMVHEK